MVRVLVVDTETTGLPRRNARDGPAAVRWPRLVEAAWLLLEETGDVLVEESHLIRPEGFTVPRQATAVHAIPDALAREEGEALADVLAGLMRGVDAAGLVVGHNVAFDLGVIRSELARAGMEDRSRTLPTCCTMKRGARLAGTRGPRENRWPKLEELHVRLFAEPYTGRHRALGDARACARCYLAMKKMGLAP